MHNENINRCDETKMDDHTKIYDIIGIGIGPFNLGMAALCENIEGLECLFIDEKASFNWHPGLMLPTARMQVPFYADLVTLSDPTSPYSFLNFLKAVKRLLRFGIHENPFATRIEYNQYCQWVAGGLSTLQFNRRCVAIRYDEQVELYAIQTIDTTNTLQTYWTRHVVIGIGTVPTIPACATNIDHPLIIHSADYLQNKTAVVKQKNITIIGAGQSAAEIFDDLLGQTSTLDQLSWFTRSNFSPMDYSAFALEMATPDYIAHFYHLGSEQKAKTLSKQDHLYKGINQSLLREIYDKLYLQQVIGERPVAQLYPNHELQSIVINNNAQGSTTEMDNSRFVLEFFHNEKKTRLYHNTGAVILATGYKNMIPDFLDAIRDHIQWNEEGIFVVNKNYSIDKNGNSVFVQNADLQSHGFNSADLGLSPYRNAVILNTIFNQEYFSIERNIAFQQF